MDIINGILFMVVGVRFRNSPVLRPSGSQVRSVVVIPWIAALASAGLLVISLPGLGLSWLAWIAFTPLFAALAGSASLSRGRAFLLGEMTGIIFYLAGCHWITHPVVDYGGAPRWLAEMLVLAASAVMAVFTGTLCLVIRDLVLRGGAAYVLTAPVWYLLSEWLRLNLTSIGWNSIAYTQAFHPSLIQFAQIAGYAGVGFLLVSVSAATALLIAVRRVRSLRLTIGVLCSVLIILTASYYASPGNRAAESNDKLPGTIRNSGPTIWFVAVQPELPIDMEVQQRSNSLALTKLLSMSERALQEHHDLDDGVVTLIWPESSLYIPLDGEDPAWMAIADFCRTRNVQVILSTARLTPDGRAFNTVVLVGARGELAGEYRKIHLLIFGEYVPFRSVFPWLNRIPALAGDFSPGDQCLPLTMADGVRVGPFVCSESAFPDLSRRMTESGANVLLNVSNDGWFGSRIMAKQHLAHSILRAVENGRPLLQVTNGGISAHVSERGVIREVWPPFQEHTGAWRVQPRGGTTGRPQRTLYARWGDWFVVLCLLAGLGSYGAALRRTWN